MLDSSIEAAGDKRHALKLLDEQLAELDTTSAGVDFNYSRESLGKRADESLGDPVRMLDQAGRKAAMKKARKARKVQDAGPAPRPGVEPSSHDLNLRVLERMQATGESDYVKTLEQILLGEE